MDLVKLITSSFETENLSFRMFDNRMEVINNDFLNTELLVDGYLMYLREHGEPKIIMKCSVSKQVCV